jgi:hypothetical protein
MRNIQIEYLLNDSPKKYMKEGEREGLQQHLTEIITTTKQQG